MKKFADIIDRVEKIRHRLGLNKSRFVGAFDMTPQTYNNFIGSEGSKPNIELISGVVACFKVNPRWLLSGTGELFEEGVEPDQLAAEFGGRPSDIAGRISVQTFGNTSLTRTVRRLLNEYTQVDGVAAFMEMRDFLNRLQTRLEKLKQPSH